MKSMKLFVLVLAVALSALPAMAQDIANMQNFVARGYAGSLTDEQIAEYTANWTEQDWTEFYVTLAKVSGMDDPEAVAAEIIAEDKALAGVDPAQSQYSTSQYSAEIPRTHQYDDSMHSADYWQIAQYGCDTDPDNDYQFVFYVSAANVLNMKWYSTNSWIGALVGAITGKLKAFGTSADTKLCVGDTRICLVGGISGCETGANWALVALKLKP